MKQRYCCDAQKSLFNDYYISQAGGALPVFQGSRGQRGHGFGSVLSGLFRSAMPMLKRIGKQALTTGAYIASDMLGGKNFGESAKARVREGINSFLPTDDTVSEQTGSGHRRRALKRKRETRRKQKRVKRLRDIFE
jgi:hypothetical protein